MRTVLAAAVLVFTALPASAQDDDPFARSRDGSIECLGPNPAARTCMAFSRYRFLENGEVVGETVMAIANEPFVLVGGASTLYARDGMICERVNRATVEAMRITVDGVDAPSNMSRELKDALWADIANVREMCTRYTPDGDGAISTFYADGVEMPEFADRVSWIRPEDGYTLAAPPEETAT